MPTDQALKRLYQGGGSGKITENSTEADRMAQEETDRNKTEAAAYAAKIKKGMKSEMVQLAPIPPAIPKRPSR